MAIKRAIILHGTMGSPEGNWFRWLGQTLKSRGLEVWLPTLPNTQQPSLKEWIEFIKTNCPFEIDKDTLVIGHSSGAILGLLLLQSGLTPGVFVGVSIFSSNSINWEPNNRLFDVPFVFDDIKKSPTKRLLVSSDTDPYVPLEQAQEIAKQSNTELIVIPGEGHFNLEQSPNYVQFPRLIELIEERELLG